MKKIIFLVLGILLLSLPTLVIAAPNKPVYATVQQVQQMIADALAPIQTSLVNLSNTVANIDESLSDVAGRVTNLESSNSSHSAAITDLQERVTNLENQPTPTSIPQPFDFTFFNGSIPTFGATSGVVDAQGYTKAVFTYQCTVGEAGIALQVSTDQVTWLTQVGKDPTQCRAGDSITINTAGRYYRMGTGSTTNPALSINAIIHFFN